MSGFMSGRVHVRVHVRVLQHSHLHHLAHHIDFGAATFFAVAAYLDTKRGAELSDAVEAKIERKKVRVGECIGRIWALRIYIRARAYISGCLEIKVHRVYLGVTHNISAPH